MPTVYKEVFQIIALLMFLVVQLGWTWSGCMFLLYIHAFDFIYVAINGPLSSQHSYNLHKLLSQDSPSLL